MTTDNSSIANTGDVADIYGANARGTWATTFPFALVRGNSQRSGFNALGTYCRCCETGNRNVLVVHAPVVEDDSSDVTTDRTEVKRPHCNYRPIGHRRGAARRGGYRAKYEEPTVIVPRSPDSARRMTKAARYTAQALS